MLMHTHFFAVYIFAEWLQPPSPIWIWEQWIKKGNRRICNLKRKKSNETAKMWVFIQNPVNNAWNHNRRCGELSWASGSRGRSMQWLLESIENGRKKQQPKTHTHGCELTAAVISAFTYIWNTHTDHVQAVYIYISNAWNCWLCSVNRIKVFLIGKHVNDAKINIWCVHFSDDTFAFKICLKHEWLYTYSQQQREKWYGKIVISHKISFYGIHKWKYWHSFSPPKLK